MKRILLIGTGGTIAAAVTESGLTPELTTEQLLAHLPAISGICEAECLQLLNLDSTHIGPEHWLMMVRCIREHYGDYDGFDSTDSRINLTDAFRCAAEETLDTSDES